jgi:hypothetical protein
VTKQNLAGLPWCLSDEVGTDLISSGDNMNKQGWTKQADNTSKYQRLGPKEQVQVEQWIQ